MQLERAEQRGPFTDPCSPQTFPFLHPPQSFLAGVEEGGGGWGQDPMAAQFQSYFSTYKPTSFSFPHPHPQKITNQFSRRLRLFLGQG